MESMEIYRLIQTKQMPIFPLFAYRLHFHPMPKTINREFPNIRNPSFCAAAHYFSLLWFSKGCLV